MQLSEATWTDVASIDAELALLPVGSTEQHGPHAPLGTDAIAADAVATAGAAAYDGDVLVAPTIPVGVAEEHRHFAGTLWVSEGAFRTYVADVARSLASHGVERVVFVNGHGGNVPALREVAARLTRDGDAYAVPFTWFDAVASASVEDPEIVHAESEADHAEDGAHTEEGAQSADAGAHADDMGHGGPVETALLRHVAPELVREDRLEAAVAGASDGWGEWVAGVNLAFDSAEFAESGVVGDPRDGDADRGAALLDAAAAALAELLGAVAERELPDPDDVAPPE